MKLPDSLRDQLKIPLGILLPIGQDNKENIRKYLSDNSYIITVGDRTTEKMIEFDLVPSIQIIDGLEKRVKRDFPKLGNASELKIGTNSSPTIPAIPCTEIAPTGSSIPHFSSRVIDDGINTPPNAP